MMGLYEVCIGLVQGYLHDNYPPGRKRQIPLRNMQNGRCQYLSIGVSVRGGRDLQVVNNYCRLIIFRTKQCDTAKVAASQLSTGPVGWQGPLRTDTPQWRLRPLSDARLVDQSSHTEDPGIST